MKNTYRNDFYGFKAQFVLQIITQSPTMPKLQLVSAAITFAPSRTSLALISANLFASNFHSAGLALHYRRSV